MNERQVFSALILKTLSDESMGASQTTIMTTPVNQPKATANMLNVGVTIMSLRIIFLFSIFYAASCFAQEDGEYSCINASSSLCVKEQTSLNMTFSPAEGVYAIIAYENEAITYTLVYEGQEIHEKISAGEYRTPKAIRVSDYNYDGLKDFSIMYADDGMEINDVYRVFIYSKKTKHFIEHLTSDGDEFFNLVVDEKNERLLSTCWREDLEINRTVPKQCVTRLPKNE
jgi:hypothetical protein